MTVVPEYDRTRTSAELEQAESIGKMLRTTTMEWREGYQTAIQDVFDCLEDVEKIPRMDAATLLAVCLSVAKRNRCPITDASG